MKSLTVGEVIAVTGLSRETLRFYEKKKLLNPARRRQNGYRAYGADDLERIAFILRTKKAGFTIRKIRELLDLKKNTNVTCRLGRDMAIEQIHYVNEQIAALTDIRDILEDFAAQCEKEGLDEPCSLSFNMQPVLFIDFNPPTASA